MLRPGGDGILVVVAQGADPDSGLCAQGGELPVGHLRVDAQEEVQSRVLLENGDALRDGALLQHGDDPVAAGAVGLSHPVDVLLKPAAGQKPRQGVLLEGGHGAAIEAQALPEYPHQGGGQDHVADADGGGKGLGEGVHIDDPSAVIHGKQCGHGVGVEAELGDIRQNYRDNNVN